MVKDRCKPLLSAESCGKLRLIKLSTSVTDCVHQINVSTPQECLLKQDLISKYQDVYSSLGHIGDAKIVVDRNVTPVQHSPRRVPVALQKDVKNKITELEEKRIITKPVEPSEWISSMVVITKLEKFEFVLIQKI